MIEAALLSTVLGLAQGQGPPDAPVHRGPQEHAPAAEPGRIRLEKTPGGDRVVVEAEFTLAPRGAFFGSVTRMIFFPNVESV